MPARSSLLPALAAAALLAAAPARAEAPPAAPAPKPTGSAAPAGGAAPSASAVPPGTVAEPARPPPLNVDYAQYGAALAASFNLSSGAICGAAVARPCILGGGGGLVIRGGYRSPGPWYFGGAYEFNKMDSGNLYRLGIFQQLRAEMRYLPDIGSRAAPYVGAAVGAAVYGNEWMVETGGAVFSIGAGVAVEVSRLALIGLGLVYRPILLVGWTDTARIDRPTGLAQFLGLELQLEVRTELGRR